MSELAGEPLPYLRVANALRRRITLGVTQPDAPEALTPGAPLPTNRSLMDDFGVSTSTAQRAVRALKAEGLVETRMGKGVFVRARRKLTTRSASYLAAPANGEPVTFRGKSVDIRVAEVEPPDDVAEELSLDVGELALRRSRTIVDRDTGEGIEIVVSYFPVDLASGTQLAAESRIVGGVKVELTRLVGSLRSPVVELVSGRMPTPEEARTLRLDQGIPVLRILRTTFAADGRPVEAEDMVYGADRYQFRYEVPTHD